jgi:hypothetical protein
MTTDSITPYLHRLLVEIEREECARIAETAGLGEPHSLPPYSVRELIAREIRNRGLEDKE